MQVYKLLPVQVGVRKLTEGQPIPPGYFATEQEARTRGLQRAVQISTEYDILKADADQKFIYLEMELRELLGRYTANLPAEVEVRLHSTGDFAHTYYYKLGLIP